MNGQPRNAEEIFDAAAEIKDPAERAHLLDEYCRGDAALRAEIEDLLRYDQPEVTFIRTPVASDFLEIDTTARETVATPVRRGTQLGPYRITELVGQGGMGSVYLAQQTNPVKRKVAIKLIRFDRESRRMLVRFEAERQALALMDHPCIARLFDAGTVAGQPFFVMEYVPGIAITRYCEQNALSVSDRVRLVLTLCKAIHHAHQKGIIHRDLKPSNILVLKVDDQPVPKIIDFGLAKATGLQLTDESIHTHIGEIVGTLQYMSPEQTGTSTADLDIRTDIYSLGAVFYELLTGTPPFEAGLLKSRPLADALQMIREVDPGRPAKRLESSQRADSARSADGKVAAHHPPSAIRGDLEWIALKAMEKDRSRRYQTALEFADDLTRYLEYRPVLASPPGILYRTRKFVRRHRTGVLVGAMLVIAAIGWGFSVRSHNRQMARDRVDRVLACNPLSLPATVDLVRPYASVATAALREKLDQTTDANVRLRVCASLGMLDNLRPTEVEILVNSLDRSLAAECSNVVEVLCGQPGNSVTLLTRRLEQSADPELRARLGIILLALRDWRGTLRMLEEGETNSNQTIFVRAFGECHVSMDRFFPILEGNPHPVVMSSLLIAIGNAPNDNLERRDRQRLEKRLEELFRSHPGGAVHSASRWAAFKLLDKEFDDKPTSPSGDREWWTDVSGQTFVRIGRGEVELAAGTNWDHPVSRRTVSVEADFEISATEVPVGAFKAFLDDPDYLGRKPLDWTTTLSGNLPVNNVSFDDAVLFCNWLSWKNGLEPCYRWVEPDGEAEAGKKGQWERVEGSCGFRLATFAEWELAARGHSGCASAFTFGGTGLIDWLGKTAWNAQNSWTNERMHFQPPARKMPNLAGVFDLAGNLREPVWDNPLASAYAKAEGMRATKGGTYRSNLLEYYVSAYLPIIADRRDEEQGIRVARTPGPGNQGSQK